MGAVGDRAIVGRGTSESTWRKWPRLADLSSLSPVDLVPHGHRVVIVAPHPDDEVLATGGILAAFAERAYRVAIIAVTDGEASHPGSQRWTPRALAQVRRLESAQALKRLGLSHAEVIHVELPDGRVHEHRSRLLRALGQTLRHDDIAFTTWRYDGHPDHEAVGAVTARACARIGIRLIEVPIWMWHWAVPNDERVPWSRLVRVSLEARHRERKRTAMLAHASQLSVDATTQRPAVLSEFALKRLLRNWEAVLM